MITINNVEFKLEDLKWWVEGLSDKDVKLLVNECDIDELWAIANEELMIRSYLFDDTSIVLN